MTSSYDDVRNPDTPIPADEAARLSPVNGRPPLPAYLSALWKRRHFVTLQAWSQTTHQHRGTLLGNVWMVLAPILDGFVYFLVFGVLFAASRSMDNYFAFLLIGVFMFSFTSRCLTSAASVISGNKGMVKAFSFPRAALPVAAVVRDAFGTLPVLITLVVLLVAVPPHVQVTGWWLLALPVLALQTLFNLGLAFIVGRLASDVPDVKHVVQYVNRLLMYGSTVMFSIDRFQAMPELLGIVRANPVFIILDMYRALLLDATMPPASQWVALTCWAVGLVVFGLVYFWRAEVSYGRP